jgi:hypothetical protein
MTGRAAEDLYTLLRLGKLMGDDGLRRLLHKVPWLPALVRRMANLSGQVVQGGHVPRGCLAATDGGQACIALLDSLLELDRLTTLATWELRGLAGPPAPLDADEPPSSN